MMEADRSWTIHVSSGKVTLTVRTEDELNEEAVRALITALDAVRALGLAMDQGNADP